MMPLLEVEGLGIDFGGLKAVDDVSFAIPSGRIYSIIGPNGAGKTTLFNMISGLYRPGRGRIFFEGADVTSLAPHKRAARGISRTFQNVQFFTHMTALENVMVGRHRHEEKSTLAHLLALPSVGRQNRLTAARARDLLAFVGLGAQADRPAAALPYAALKRLELARALACEPKLLLLDEPAAGCNSLETHEIERLIRAIAACGVTVALVEHSMQLVMGVSDHILVLHYGRRLTEGTAEEVRSNPDVIAAYLGPHALRQAAHA
jgi:branched-chain amino acid transport system ATP-binding protein